MKGTDTTKRDGTAAFRLVESCSGQVSVDMAGLSNKGLVRPANQDQFLIVRLDRSLNVISSSLPDYLIPAAASESVYGLVVADGLGGPAGGEVASRLAIRTLLELVVQTPDWIMRDDDKHLEGALRRQGERFQSIRTALRRFASMHPALGNMGTTLTIAASLGTDAVIAHTGDSRAYLYHAGKLQRLTRDHTRVQELVDSGSIKPDEAAKHPMRHHLTSAITAKDSDMRVELKRCRLADGDRMLLCTDGLTNMVSDEQIASVLGGSDSAMSNCYALMRLALDAGGTDNITVVVARYKVNMTT